MGGGRGVPREHTFGHSVEPISTKSLASLEILRMGQWSRKYIYLFLRLRVERLRESPKLKLKLGAVEVVVKNKQTRRFGVRSRGGRKNAVFYCQTKQQSWRNWTRKLPSVFSFPLRNRSINTPRFMHQRFYFYYRLKPHRFIGPKDHPKPAKLLFPLRYTPGQVAVLLFRLYSAHVTLEGE